MGDGTTTHTQNLLDKKTRPRIALAYPILALQQTRLPRMKGFHAMRLIQEGSFAYFTADIAFDPAKPSLIFIHGAAMDGGFWKLQLEALGHAVNPLALNLPGRKKTRPWRPLTPQPNRLPTSWISWITCIYSILRYAASPWAARSF